ncbi:alpha/beta fold hydrolase [Dokdonella koreensis]|uniref:Alpha/beta hydrolase fold domain-containing protein n=1 Tax=Dokdonella koreensis DS-123 TaxID=1300342 RepID=A0A160DY67_9GAMM|nr:alpha/beta hydrolase [Dokdonella koreensis]ANB19707.1 Alpha/beta hydrolase fold domain-containing protein [Dokdonella koreensis DS-123]
MTEARERRFDVPHLPIAARCWGDPALPPLLALHGWLDNAGSFDHLAPRLAAHHQVIAIDLAGHGRSGHRPAGTWYPYIDFLDEILGVVEQLGRPRIDLLGHSLGGTLASVFAGIFPERVGRLALIEALGPLTAAAGDTRERLRRGIGERAARRGDRRRVFDSIDTAVAARLAAGGLSAAAARPIVERGLQAVDGGLAWSSDARLRLASPARFTEDQVLDLLAGIDAATLLVLTEPETAYLPRAWIERRAAEVAAIEIVRLAGGHHLHLERPGPVADALLDFFGRHPPRA